MCAIERAGRGAVARSNSNSRSITSTPRDICNDWHDAGLGSVRADGRTSEEANKRTGEMAGLSNWPQSVSYIWFSR